MLEDALETEPLAVLAGAGDGLLEDERRLAVAQHEAGDLVVEPRLVVGVAPADRGRLDTGAGAQHAAEQAAEARGGDPQHAPLLLVERVAERRADRLPDVRAHPG